MSIGEMLWYGALTILTAICIGGALSWIVVFRRARYFARSNRRLRDGTTAVIAHGMRGDN
jgi:hypothetical protein